MKQITVQQALELGYELCGYDDLENQSLKQINELEPEDFEPFHCSILCVAHKESHSVSIASEEVTEWLIDKYFDTDGNPDDTNDIENLLKERTDILDDFVYKINELYATKKWWFIDSDIQLIPNK